LVKICVFFFYFKLFLHEAGALSPPPLAGEESPDTKEYCSG